ncbi:MAG: SCP2 sterol-binding domain-containing protein [Alphaproteobacteria bacterium]|nr:SCP2 sterol-binding domain-containing protein [Alphaproteobacteria bacterium]
MDLAGVTERLRRRVGEDCGLGAKVKFDFGADGVILLDASRTPNEIGNQDGEADCTLSIALDDFVAIGEGELDPMTAFMLGKLKVSGDMGLAMRLQKILR